MLTNNEKKLISQAACDFETGNHLLQKRSKEQLDMMKEISITLRTSDELRTERQKEIAEEYRLCTDYDYWKSKQSK
jgi:hypothetical protein